MSKREQFESFNCLMQQSRRTAQEIIEADPCLESPVNAVLRKYFMEKHKINDFSMIS